MAQLKTKHFKALELFEEGTLSLKEIAHAVGINISDFYDLVEGDTKSVGDTATLFRAEIEKITKRSNAKIKVLVKDTKKIALQLLNDRIRQLKSKSALTGPQRTEYMKALDTLSKVTPKVEIGSFAIHKGLSAEDLVNEFKRLSALARQSLNGGRVQSPQQGQPGTLPGSSAGGNRLPKE